MTVTIAFRDIYLGGERLKDSPLFNLYSRLWKAMEKSPDRSITDTPLFGELMNQIGESPEYTEEFVADLLTRMARMYESFSAGGYNPDAWGEYPVVTYEDGRFVLQDGLNRVNMLSAIGEREAKFSVVQDGAPYADIRLEGNGDGYLKRLVDEAHSQQPRYDPPRMVDEQMNLYLPINHPRYEGDICSRFDSPLRLGLILDEISEPEGLRFLDVGANTGYFSVELSRLGARCVGVDPVLPYLKIAKFMARYHGLNRSTPDGRRWIKFYPMTLRRYLDETEERFNCVLFMGLFHHLMRQNPLEAWSDLRLLSLRAPEMFFETALTGEPQMEGLPELHENTVIGEVLDHSIYKDGKQLCSGFKRDWRDRGVRPDLPLRPMYRFWR